MSAVAAEHPDVARTLTRLAPERRIAGVDAGGSATRVAVAAGGRIQERWSVGGMNALLEAELPQILAGIARRARAELIVVGMPGARRPADAEQIVSSFAALNPTPMMVIPDIEAAYAGAFLGGPGIVVAAGTGSVAYGCDLHRSARAGGHGFLLGDDGGAYWIGRQAVRSALLGADRGVADGPLTAAVIEVSGCDLDELVARVHRAPTERSLLTRLAPVVTALAPQDPDAARIVERAADALVALAQVMAGKLGPLPVCGIGGVLQSTAIWERFSAGCGAVRPLAPPQVGALILGARRLAPADAGPDAL